jgi:catechol 2,3-dioxygenase-like lactoylglutathione lyase family enzyme
MIESISAVTLATHDMSRAVHFYRALGFEIVHGGEEAEFTSFRAGTSFLNLIARPRRKAGLGGRVTFCHSDADTLYAGVIAAGYRPNSAPRDDKWGERYFYLTTDPDGHQPSFASPLATY